jgi:inosine-uridine nucleoside N-ribohydrolase
MSNKKKVILDVDPGHDDAVAILLAAKSEKLDLRGITVVAGNQTLPKTLKNTINVCSYAGLKDIPVYAGMAKPLIRNQVVAEDIHGDSGLDGPEFPATDMRPQEKHAVDFIIEEVLSSEDKITLIPTGPLTNIALALIREPEIKNNIAEIVLMGGAYTLGNVTPAAEFNIYVDPEAAKVVFESGLPITMVGLDLTHQAKAYPDIVERIKGLNNKVSDLVVELLKFFGKSYHEVFDFPAPPLHDVCAVARVIDDQVFTTKRMRVDIEVDSKLNYGRTVCDYYGVTKLEPNAEVAIELDQDRFWNLLIDALAKYN